LINVDQPSAQLQAWRAQAGLQRPYIVLQASESTADLAAWLSANAAAFAAYQFVNLPIGPDLNDHVDSLRLQGLSVITVHDWPPPLLLAEIIAHAEAVAGISLHLAITATAFGLPVLRSAERRDEKYRALSAFETVLEYAKTSELSAESVLAHWRTRMPHTALTQLQDRLDTHWDAVATALSATEPDRLASQNVNAFWQSLPDILEAAIPPEILTEKEQAVAQIEKMKNSTSWRVTRPLREFMRFWRKQPSSD
jgi:lipopolysaccharide transport system ATP-binding protein